MDPIYLYLLATVLFILGIKGLCKVRSARMGNRLAAIGMLIAIVGALYQGNVLSPVWIVIGLVVGGAVGLRLGAKVGAVGTGERVGDGGSGRSPVKQP